MLRGYGNNSYKANKRKRENTTPYTMVYYYDILFIR